MQVLAGGAAAAPPRPGQQGGRSLLWIQGEATTGIVQHPWIRAAYNLVLPWILITPAESAPFWTLNPEPSWVSSPAWMFHPPR